MKRKQATTAPGYCKLLIPNTPIRYRKKIRVRIYQFQKYRYCVRELDCSVCTENFVEMNFQILFHYHRLNPYISFSPSAYLLMSPLRYLRIYSRSPSLPKSPAKGQLYLERSHSILIFMLTMLLFLPQSYFRRHSKWVLRSIYIDLLCQRISTIQCSKLPPQRRPT